MSKPVKEYYTVHKLSECDRTTLHNGVMKDVAVSTASNYAVSNPNETFVVTHHVTVEKNVLFITCKEPS